MSDLYWLAPLVLHLAIGAALVLFLLGVALGLVVVVWFFRQPDKEEIAGG